MGNHYVPQYYLQGFSECESSKEITTYFKKDDKFKVLPIKKIAQQRKFYSEEVEKYLANEIEYPAKELFGKIKQHRTLTKKEKEVFSKYLIVVLKRVPAFYSKLKVNAPEVIEPIYDTLEKFFTESITNRNKVDIAKNRLLELNWIRESKTDSIIYNAWLNTIKPEETPDILKALQLMTWIFFVTNGEKYFITSDNPFFFFESIGMGNKYSEVTFPISKNISLWATWRTDITNGSYVIANKEVIKEINNRTIVNSTDFIFSPKKLNCIREISTSGVDLRLIR